MISLTISTLEILAWKGTERLSDDEVLELLFDDDYKVRSIAGRVIQLRGNRYLFTKILDLTENQSSFLREISAFILGQFDTPTKGYRDKSLPILSKLIKDEDFEVRAAAISSIGHLYNDDKDCMPDVISNELLLATHDEFSLVRECAVVALASANKSEKIIKRLNFLLKHDIDKGVREATALALDIIFN